MSLIVLTKVDKIECVHNNDIFFDTLNYVDDDIILTDVEHASYVDKNHIYNKVGETQLSTEFMSTGVKTYFNVKHFTTKCFDLVETGRNVLLYVFRLRSGIVYFGRPWFYYDESIVSDVDIIWNGTQYTDMNTFVQALRREYL